jgi:GNAT superfamily N-acetyltransferase
MRIRKAAPTDYEAFAAIAPELGADWRVPSEQDWLSDLAAKSLVAELDGNVVGYVMGVPAGNRGYVHQLAVGPQNRRRGAGRLLLRAMADQLRGSGCSEWQLNVEGNNDAARALYERFGMQPLVRKCWVEIERGALAKLPSDPTVRGRLIAPDDDLCTEQRFGLAPGSMHRYRQTRAMPLEAVDASGHRVGFGAYLVEQRLVRPLQVFRGDALRALLAPAGNLPERIRLVAEHEEILQMLLSAGGVPCKEELQYVGPLDQQVID